MVTLYDGGLTLRYFKLFKKVINIMAISCWRGRGPLSGSNSVLSQLGGYSLDSLAYL